MTARLDALIDDDLVASASDRTIDELRTARDACQAFESGLSFIRRMVQGRLDIVGAEVARRRLGERPLDTASLVATLPELLSDEQSAAASARAVGITPPDIDDELIRQLDDIVGMRELSELGSMSDELLDTVSARLAELEAEISSHRRRLHAHIDAIQTEIIGRYQRGDADVDSLLRQA